MNSKDFDDLQPIPPQLFHARNTPSESSTMKCREAKHDMALQLGRDLQDPARWESVRRHVSTCDECRTHYKKLKRSMTTLEQSQSDSTYEVRGSLWPELESRLDAAETQKRPLVKKWLPVASVMVAAMLFVAVMLQPPANTQGPIHTSSKGMFSWGTPTQISPPVENNNETEKPEPEEQENEANL